MSPNEKAAVAAAAQSSPFQGRTSVTRIIRTPRGNASTLTEKPGYFKETGRFSTEMAPVLARPQQICRLKATWLARSVLRPFP